MNRNIEDYRKAVENAVSNDKIKEALRLLRTMVPGAANELRAEIEHVGEDYDRIINYALTGNPDPSRNDQLSYIRSRLYSALDLAIREKEIVDTPTLYYNTARTERLRPAESIPALVEALRHTAEASSTFSTAGLPAAEVKTRRLAAEAAERRVFERVWVTVPLSADDAGVLMDAAADDSLPERDRLLIISALTLNALQFYSERTLLTLLRAAQSENIAVRIRATVGAVLVMDRWPRRSNSVAVDMQLEILRQTERWSKDVEMVMLQLIRTADVEKISRQMQQEIIPEMMKLRPDLYKRINNPEEPIEMNPEWEEMLEKSGLRSKLEKLSEMQSDGGDLFFSAFSMLKGYAFFNHPSAWFLPFETERSEVAETLGHDLTMGEMVRLAPTMCDGDKYSFILSLHQLPEVHKQAITSQLEQSNVNLAELAGAELMPEEQTRRSLLARYVQDLYRFFRLFRRKGEFIDPFARIINPVGIPALAADFREEEKLRLVGEFFFKHGHWDEAIELFRRVTPDHQSWQKIGLALRKTGHPAEAAEAFEKADMERPDSTWTLHQLGMAFRAAGMPDKALVAFNRLENLEPDSAANALNIGYCHLELGNYHEALHNFYKAEFMDEKSSKPLRPIAWSAFINGDFETSRKYFDRLMAVETPTHTDYLNMGHLALAMGQMREALNFYRLFSPEPSKLRDALRADSDLLLTAGVDITLIPLIADFYE